MNRSRVVRLRARVSTICLIANLALIFGLSAVDRAHATEVPTELKDVGISEKLGSQVSLHDLEFLDEGGQSVRLESFFKPGHPVLLSLVYFECPNLCNFVLNGLVDGLKSLNEPGWAPGQKFDVIAVSIDPRDSPRIAAAKRAAYAKSYGHADQISGWHFLTAQGDQAKRLADQVGFGYRWDEKEQQYAHGAGIFALTPEGKVSRVLYGIQFQAKELKLALLEASNGKIGTVIDRLVLFCFSYNPATHKYSLALTRVMQSGSVAMVLGFGGFLGTFWRRERRQSQADLASQRNKGAQG